MIFYLYRICSTNLYLRISIDIYETSPVSPVFLINMVGVLTSLCRKTNTGIPIVLTERRGGLYKYHKLPLPPRFNCQKSSCRFLTFQSITTKRSEERRVGRQHITESRA